MLQYLYAFTFILQKKGVWNILEFQSTCIQNTFVKLPSTTFTFVLIQNIISKRDFQLNCFPNNFLVRRVLRNEKLEIFKSKFRSLEMRTGRAGPSFCGPRAKRAENGPKSSPERSKVSMKKPKFLVKFL